MKNNLILSSKVLNKKYIAKCLGGIIFAIILCGIFLTCYLKCSFPQYVEFCENGNIDYKVFLEENDFFVNKI